MMFSPLYTTALPLVINFYTEIMTIAMTALTHLPLRSSKASPMDSRRFASKNVQIFGHSAWQLEQSRSGHTQAIYRHKLVFHSTHVVIAWRPAELSWIVAKSAYPTGSMTGNVHRSFFSSVTSSYLARHWFSFDYRCCAKNAFATESLPLLCFQRLHWLDVKEHSRLQHAFGKNKMGEHAKRLLLRAQKFHTTYHDALTNITACVA